MLCAHQEAFKWPGNLSPRYHLLFVVQGCNQTTVSRKLFNHNDLEISPCETGGQNSKSRKFVQIPEILEEARYEELEEAAWAQ